MTTSIPSGLGTSVGFSAEATVGTATTTSMRWIQVDKITAEYKKTTVTSTGLHQGLYQQSGRRAFLTKEASLQLTTDVVANKLGLLFKHMLGSSATTTQQAAGTVYLQTHQPGDTLLLGLTTQVGKTATDGTVQKFTYSGGKVTDWQLSIQRGSLAKFDLSLDAWLEDTSTAYAAPTFAATDVYDFHQGALTTAGTITYPSSIVTVTSDAAPAAIVSGVTIKGVNPLKTDRFNIGSQTKVEQIANGFRSITGTIDLEFRNITDVYALLTGDTAAALHVSLTGPVPTGGNAITEKLDIIIPKIYVDSDQIDVSGPDVLMQKVAFTALDDATTAMMQLQYYSTDTTV